MVAGSIKKFSLMKGANSTYQKRKNYKEKATKLEISHI